MAPALTKILKDGHGIHLSSPLSSARDSTGRAVHRTEVDPHVRLTEDAGPQMWLNLSLCPSLDPCLAASPPKLPPNPAPLLRFLSLSEDLRDSPQVVSVLPGVPDMFLGPVPEDNSKEACLLHGRGAAHECGPDGGDVHGSPFTLASVSPSDVFGEINSQDCAQTQERAAAMDRAPLASEQPCSGRLNFDLLVPRAALVEAMKEQISKQEELRGQARRLQKRLQALLGEHALRHCDQQLEGLTRHIRLGDGPNDGPNDGPDSSHPGVAPPQAGGELFLSPLESSTASSSFTGHRELSRSGQAVLRGLQEALDSEATASSSSDDEVEEEKSVSSSRCARRWLQERVELGSRWSWLQLRLSKLEGRIPQLVELHKHIRSSKGGVVLAASRPLTDRQIQQTLLKEVRGLCCTKADADTEPCSPTHLLHSIERQSAQLSQIVRSLMPPLSLSPLSKQAQTCRDEPSFTSGRRGDAALDSGAKRRRLVAATRRHKADACVCARTRPLVSYHKPKLFTVNTRNNPSSSQEPWKSMSTLSSPLPSSSHPCDPLVLRSNPERRSSGSALTSRRTSSGPHCSSSLSCDTPQAHHPQRGLGREEWSQRPLVINSRSPTRVHSKRRCSTPLHRSHKYKQHARRHESRAMELSPIRMTGSARGRHRRANQKERKRRQSPGLDGDDKDKVSYRSREPEGSSDDVLEERDAQFSQKRDSQGSGRKRQGENVYNINNIVIPMSLSKVEKPQYKDILTPRWRLLCTQSMKDKETDMKDSEEGQVEDLSDEAFAQRHMALEQKEKLRWSSWGKRKCFRHPTRSGSRLSGGGGGMFTSGEESSAEWSGAQLETDEQPSSEEWLPETPWERRLFLLDEDEDTALLCDTLETETSGWSESGYFSVSNKSNSPEQSPGATLPPGARSSSTTPQGS